MRRNAVEGYLTGGGGRKRESKWGRNDRRHTEIHTPNTDWAWAVLHVVLGPSPWVSLWPLPPKAMGMDKRTRPRMGQSRDLRLAKVEGRPWLGCAQSEGLCEGEFPGVVTVCWKVLWAPGRMCRLCWDVKAQRLRRWTDTVFPCLDEMSSDCWAAGGLGRAGLKIVK